MDMMARKEQAATVYENERLHMTDSTPMWCRIKKYLQH
jgi:hypothetical protein